jgi:ubiquinol-cytochrome c reductase cytochrome c1 subunit
VQLEETREVKDGKEIEKFVLKTLTPGAGAVSQLEYDKTVTDLVNYMNYMAEPARLQRRQIGIYALLLLGVLFVLVFALKKSYWKDVH